MFKYPIPLQNPIKSCPEIVASSPVFQCYIHAETLKRCNKNQGVAWGQGYVHSHTRVITSIHVSSKQIHRVYNASKVSITFMNYYSLSMVIPPF